MLQEQKGDQNMVDASELSDRRLFHLEAVIQRYRQDFYAVGKALNEIRNGRHYQKLSFKTFERYVNVRWDMSKSQAYRLIEAFAVIVNLSPIGDVLPKNEAQARPLTRLDSHSQRKAWRDFLKTQKPLSALNIKRFISLDEQKQPSRFVEIVSEQYIDAVSAMLSQISVAQNDRWRSTTQRSALYWNKVMREKILWG
jgi:transcription antitermination factor NusG